MWIYIKADGLQTEFRERNASQEVHCQQNSASQQKPYTLLSAFFLPVFIRIRYRQKSPICHRHL